MDYKYVVFNDEYPVVLPGSLNHADVYVRGATPTSAGFFQLDLTAKRGRAITVSGESETLGLSSKSFDAILLSILLGV